MPRMPPVAHINSLVWMPSNILTVTSPSMLVGWPRMTWVRSWISRYRRMMYANWTSSTNWTGSRSSGEALYNVNIICSTENGWIYRSMKTNMKYATCQVSIKQWIYFRHKWRPEKKGKEMKKELIITPNVNLKYKCIITLKQINSVTPNVLNLAQSWHHSIYFAPNVSPIWCCECALNKSINKSISHSIKCIFCDATKLILSGFSSEYVFTTAKFYEMNCLWSMLISSKWVQL